MSSRLERTLRSQLQFPMGRERKKTKGVACGETAKMKKKIVIICNLSKKVTATDGIVGYFITLFGYGNSHLDDKPVPQIRG